jgi:hypothetical protein
MNISVPNSPCKLIFKNLFINNPMQYSLEGKDY